MVHGAPGPRERPRARRQGWEENVVRAGWAHLGAGSQAPLRRETAPGLGVTQGSQHTVFGELSHGFPLESPSPASSVRWAPRKVWPQGKVLNHMGPSDVQPSEARPGGWMVAPRLWGACWGRWRRGAGATPHRRGREDDSRAR